MTGSGPETGPGTGPEIRPGAGPGAAAAGGPDLSVVLIVRHPGEDPGAVLAALAAEPGAEGVETILVEGRPGAGEEPGGTPPEDGAPPGLVRLVRPGLNMPRLKAEGAAAARGGAIAFLEPKGVPAPGWLAAARAALAARPGAALGGPVTAAPGGGAADGAAYLFEYAAFAPDRLAAEGLRDLPGNNMILPAAALRSLCGDILEAQGLNKPFCQARLVAGGVPLSLAPGLEVRLHSRHRLGALLASRFRYARCFGGTRAALAPRRRLWAYRLGAPAIPALLLARHLRAMGRADGRASRPRGVLPALAALCLAWSAGEALGSWAGAGRSCEALY